MLSLVNPLSCKSKVQQAHLNQEQQVRDSRERSFEVGNKVLYRNVNKDVWERGTVCSHLGSKLYGIQPRGPLLVRFFVPNYAVPHSVTLVNYAAIVRLKSRNYAAIVR